MIDLHIHTNNSDGTWSTKELLEEAEKLNLDVISITDHDNVDSYVEIEENKELNNIFKGKIIRGVELNTVFDGIKIEVLAYDIDVKKMKKWLDEYYSKENVRSRFIEEFNDLVKACEKNNIRIEEDLTYNPETEYPVDVIYGSIVKFKENKKFFNEDVFNNMEKFYRTCTVDKNFPLYLDFSKQLPILEFVSDLVKKCGGKVFLAHLFKYRLDNHMEFLQRIVDKKLIDGIEVYHSSFKDEECEILRKYCLDNTLYMSGGSDCHGDKKKERKLGIGYGNLNIDKKIIKNWFEI